MNLNNLLGLIAFISLCGCSSSSSEPNSPGVNESQTLRLISEQITFSNGASSQITYQYDQAGNLSGLVGDDGDSTIYNISADGRIIDTIYSDNENASRPAETYHYDETRGLRRIDNLGYIEGVGILGVSSFKVYQFDGELATGLERRVIRFEDIVLNGQVDDTDGANFSTTEFQYDGEFVIRELLSRFGNDSVYMRDYSYNADGTLASTETTGPTASSSVFMYEQGACNTNWGNSTHRYFCVAVDEQ